MANKTIAVFLTNQNNDYQQLLQADATSAAHRYNLDLQLHFSGTEVTQQIRQIYGCIYDQLNEHPAAILLHPVRDAVVTRAAQDIARAGIPLIVLNRTPEVIERLRSEYKNLPISAVSPDQREIGRIQGRQFRKLLPKGGLLLYVQGNPATTAARLRLEGVNETIVGTDIDMALVDGDFSPERAEAAVAGWLRVVLPGDVKVALVGCQNDGMAVGARRALETIAAEMNHPDLLDVPLTGVDGLPDFGQRLVREGKLVATVTVPSTTGKALELLSRALDHGDLPPAQVLLSPTAYPDVNQLLARS
jgi:ABC-type sugar transport system substrate-binding protein